MLYGSHETIVQDVRCECCRVDQVIKVVSMITIEL